jgi:glycosyltransferase involved in cell wall biosynthesis
MHVFTFSRNRSNVPNVVIHTFGNANLPKILWIPSYWYGLYRGSRRLIDSLDLDLVIGNGFSELPLTRKLVDVPRMIVMHQSAKRVIKIVRPTLLERLQNVNNEMGVAPLFDPIIVKRVDKVIAVSDYVKKSLIEDLDLDPNRIEVVLNGFSDFYVPVEEKEKYRWKNERKLSGKGIVLFVGRINDKRKGLLELIKAFNLIPKNLNLQLVVVGSGEADVILEHIRNYDLMDRVSLLGRVSDEELRKLYTICDLYVSSSYYESFGLTLVEAMSCKKPVIARDIGGISEVVTDDNGILLRDDSTRTLADSIIEVFKYKEKYADIGKANREYSINKFSWERAAERLENIALELVGDKGA